MKLSRRQFFVSLVVAVVLMVGACLKIVFNWEDIDFIHLWPTR